MGIGMQPLPDDHPAMVIWRAEKEQEDRLNALGPLANRTTEYGRGKRSAEETRLRSNISVLQGKQAELNAVYEKWWEENKPSVWEEIKTPLLTFGAGALTLATLGGAAPSLGAVAFDAAAMVLPQAVLNLSAAELALLGGAAYAGGKFAFDSTDRKDFSFGGGGSDLSFLRGGSYEGEGANLRGYAPDSLPSGGGIGGSVFGGDIGELPGLAVSSPGIGFGGDPEKIIFEGMV